MFIWAFVAWTGQYVVIRTDQWVRDGDSRYTYTDKLSIFRVSLGQTSMWYVIAYCEKSVASDLLRIMSFRPEYFAVEQLFVLSGSALIT